MNMSARIALSVFIALLLLCATAAANPEILAAHNVYRNEVGVVPLTYNQYSCSQCPERGQSMMQVLVLWYTVPRMVLMGKILRYGGRQVFPSWTDIVNLWGSEKSYFIYGPLGDGSSTYRKFV